jgi:2-iminoacetate synthase
MSICAPIDPTGRVQATTRNRLPKLEFSEGCVDFIDDAKLEGLISHSKADPVWVREIIAKAMTKTPLAVEETAVLCAADDPELDEELFAAARRLKETVYGNRIVLFAPLYVGNRCVNECTYCGFRASNHEAQRSELDAEALTKQVRALERQGHKRTILVFGEHPRYDATYIREAVDVVYATKLDRKKDGVSGDIRRVNINAAPQDDEGFRIIKDAGIGTFQIFQETYHHATYAKVHDPKTRKGNYLYRLDGLSRAFKAGIDDLGIGALFGLADWRFDVLGLVSHAKHLMDRFGTGPHTISFPRLKAAQGVAHDNQHLVNDRDFKRLVAILRLSVPYTGMILTARETAELRDEILGFGVSQIDAGTRIDLGGYEEEGDAQVRIQRPKHEQHPEKAQFELGDTRSLADMVVELTEKGYLPSFCTSCYRAGRTGEVFMEYAIPGFIQKLCTPNALTTFQEFLEDYGTPEAKAKGAVLIERELASVSDDKLRTQIQKRLGQIRSEGARDLFW